MDSFGFAKYFDVRDSELCIRGFYKLGYEVGFARVCITCHGELNIPVDDFPGIVQFSP
jgi:hypothetical protein